MGCEKDASYIVVFRGRGDGMGNHKDILTWTKYRSLEEFNGMWEQTTNSDEIFAQGVTEEEAVELVRQTPIQAYVNSALLEATNPDGSINEDLLQRKLTDIALLYPEKVGEHVLGN